MVTGSTPWSWFISICLFSHYLKDTLLRLIAIWINLTLPDITDRTALTVWSDVLNANYHVITNATCSCHNRTLCWRSSNMSRILKLVRYYAVIISRCGNLSGCKHCGKRCSLPWQKNQNSSKILMYRLMKVDEKTSLNNIIHVRNIRS